MPSRPLFVRCETLDVQPRSRTVGVTIDGYAVEGGYDTDGGPSTSFGIAQALGSIRRSVRSPSTFNHLPELVERVADLGVDEVRLTMEWARLEPRPDEFDDEAFGVYDRALQRAERRGISAVVVLCDVAWPSWLGQEPWLSTWAPVRFAAHARRLGTLLDGRLRALVTFRAPNAAARGGWIEGIVPPFRRRAAPDSASALDGMLLAHQLASDALADATPATPRALLLEGSWDYADERALHDVATGADEPARAASEAAWRSSVPRSVASPRRRRGHVDLASLPSSRRWDSTPPFEWWVASTELDLLTAVLAHSAGSVATVELGAGTSGWTRQLDGAQGALGNARAMHLHGALDSSGPLRGPRGLVSLDQHDGGWTLAAPDDRVVDAIATLRV
jgi:Glycosyl hydrolase family 1